MRENPGSRTFKFLDMHAYNPWFRLAFSSWRVQVKERTLANNIQIVNPVCLQKISAHYDLEEPENLLKHINHNFSRRDRSGTHTTVREYQLFFSNSAPIMKTCLANVLYSGICSCLLSKKKKDWNLKSNVTYMSYNLAQSNTTVYQQIWCASLG